MYKGSKRRGINISRPCYDKYHRCPGWAGGGMKSGKETQCDGGYVTMHYKRGWEFMPHRCAKCHVIVLPFYIRYLDPSYARYIPSDIKNKLNIYWLLKLKPKLRRWGVS